MISSSPVTKPSTQSQPTAWKKTRNGCSPFMTSRLNTGPIFGRPTPSNQPLQPCAFVRSEPKGVAHATLTMVFKFGIEAQKHWRRLNGSALLLKVVTGVQFIDGIELQEQAA